MTDQLIDSETRVLYCVKIIMIDHYELSVGSTAWFSKIPIYQLEDFDGSTLGFLQINRRIPICQQDRLPQELLLDQPEDFIVIEVLQNDRL